MDKRHRIVPAARRRAQEAGVDPTTVTGSGPEGTILMKDIVEAIRRRPTGDAGAESRARASGVARRLAESQGIQIQTIEGTGIRSKVMKADVQDAFEKLNRRSDTVEAQESVFGKTIPMSQMRKVISKRMVESAFTAPHIYLFTDVEMDQLCSLRAEILSEIEKRYGVRVSVNDFLIKATAEAIRDCPMLNAKVTEESIFIQPEINIGFAVALEGGLLVPAIPRADQLGLGKIAQVRCDLVSRARSRQLSLEEIERGTFTISSLAEFDITFFTAIINPPQSGIVSVCKIVDTLTLKGAQVAQRKTLRLGLAVDHRIIDGALAGRFLQSIKKKLETPRFALRNL